MQTHNAQMKHFDAAGVDSANKSSSNNNSKEGEQEQQKKRKKITIKHTYLTSSNSKVNFS